MEKIIIITGGASGLGLEMAKYFLYRDHNVCVIDGAQDKVDKLQSLKEEYSNLKILTYCANVANEASIEKIINEIASDYEIEYLFNNAGIIRAGHFSKNSKEVVDSVFESIIVGSLIVTSKVLPHMKKINSGKIINIMSSAALLGKANESVYCAAKFALKGFTLALKEELKPTNIRVVGVFPGGINTPFYENIREYTPKYVSDKYMNAKKVARVICENSLQIETLSVSDISIERV